MSLSFKAQAAFVNPDGTLTREGLAALRSVAARAGGDSIEVFAPMDRKPDDAGLMQPPMYRQEDVPEVFQPSMGIVGYPAGGGTVTQATSKSTGVTLDRPCGQITMNAAALDANTTVSFMLTNSMIAASDRVIAHRVSGGTAVAYNVWVDSVAAGSCVIALRNITAVSLPESPVIGFAVVKAATS